MQDTSPVESFTEMLNRQEDDCHNESTGVSFIWIVSLHLLKLWLCVLVDLPVFPDMPRPVDYNHGLNWNSIDTSFPSQSMANSTEFGFEFNSAKSGFNFDFENMDINALALGNLDHNVSTIFNYEQAFMEAALLIGVQ